MDEMDTEGLVLLIEAAAKAGATHIKVGDFEMSFTAKPAAAPNQNHTHHITSNNDDEHKEIDAEDEKRVIEQNLSELLLTDPLKYEELLMREGVPADETEADA